MTPSSERPRPPRERLTEIVRAIAREVARQETHTVRCRDPWVEPYDASFRAVALWAFSSWARGAPSCGDADLIVEVEKVGEGQYSAPERAVSNAIRRRRRHVDLHVGTPEKLGDVAADVVLLWSPEQPDYASAIDGLAINPDAGRHKRPLDVLPLDPRRLLMPFGERDELPVAIASGTVDSMWLPAESIPALDPDLAAWADRISLGKETRRVLPLALEALARWLPVAEVPESWTRGRSRSSFGVGGVRLSFERWHHSHHELDQLGCRALVVVPHWKQRGPNGVLFLTRGAQHPLVERFTRLESWAVGQGVVQSSQPSGPEPWSVRAEARLLELFTSRAAAEEGAAGWDIDASEVRPIVGPALLDAIDGVDAVAVDGQVDVEITPRGARYLRLAELLVDDVRPAAARLWEALSR